MLRSLTIRDFVIVDSLELDFEAGFTALTGETGAGKSILIDALSLALGARADGNPVRVGQSRAEIAAEFDLAALVDARTWLSDNELADDDPEEARYSIGAALVALADADVEENERERKNGAAVLDRDAALVPLRAAFKARLS